MKKNKDRSSWGGWTGFAPGVSGRGDIRTKNDRLRKKTTCKGCGGNKKTFISNKHGGALTQDEKTTANRWSHIAASAYEKPEDRQKYLRDSGIDDLEIDPGDSSFQNEHTAAYKTKDGKPIMALKGTGIKNKHDLTADLGMVSGDFHKTRRYEQWDDSLDSLIDKHGKMHIDRLVGHSLGARGALELGKKKHNIASGSFNTGSAPADIASNLTQKK